MGAQLRKNILRLPEAPGKRTGIAGKHPVQMRIVSIGESPLAGVGLENQAQNLTALLAEKIQNGKKINVEWFVFAKTGIRMQELLPTFESVLPKNIDVIFIAMGVNDCKEATSMWQWIQHWKTFHQYLSKRYPNTTIICSSTPPMDCFPALPWPVKCFLGSRSRLMNTLLEAQILNWNSTHYLPIPNVLSQAYFAKDGFHPNAAAHHQWSEALFDKIQDIKIVKEAEAYPN